MATTDIEHGFVSAELQAREDTIACVKFTETTAGEHHNRHDPTPKTKKLKRVSDAEVSGQSPSHEKEPPDCPSKANDEHRANGSTTIETIIGCFSAHAYPRKPHSRRKSNIAPHEAWSAIRSSARPVIPRASTAGFVQLCPTFP